MIERHASSRGSKNCPVSLSRGNASSSQLSHSAGHDLGELVGAVVALGVPVVRVAVEVQRLDLHAGGDEVPAGAAAADVVERGELARDVERLVVARRGGADQPDALGHARRAPTAA